MFDSLKDRFNKVLHRIRGVGRITKEDMESTLKSIKDLLIDSDVSLPVIENFIDKIAKQASERTLLKTISPGETVTKIIHKELVDILGKNQSKLNLKISPAVFLIVGLQGSGKTTTSSKLAYWLKRRYKKSVMLTSVDIYRPAAIKQLELLSSKVSARYFHPGEKDHPVEIAKNAFHAAKKSRCDVLIIDTAGRTYVDKNMMEEIKDISKVTRTAERLLVVDGMTGQNAANIAAAFDNALGITGTILTKMDGDSKGGAAISIKSVTGKSIKFIGTGENMEDLENFCPKITAARILDIPDTDSFIEALKEPFCEKSLDSRFKAKDINFNDYLKQINNVNGPAGIKTILKNMPGISKIPGLKNFVSSDNLSNEKDFAEISSIIQNMTEEERNKPEIIDKSRKERIARDSGSSVNEINRLLKQFFRAKKLLQKVKGNNNLKNIVDLIK